MFSYFWLNRTPVWTALIGAFRARGVLILQFYKRCAYKLSKKRTGPHFREMAVSAVCVAELQHGATRAVNSAPKPMAALKAFPTFVVPTLESISPY